MRRKFLWIFALFVLAPNANAQLLGISDSSNGAPIFPYGTDFWPDLTGNMHVIESVTWYMKCDMAGATHGNFEILTSYETNYRVTPSFHYGSHTIKVRVDWGETPGLGRPNPAFAEVTRTINIPIPSKTLLNPASFNLPVDYSSEGIQLYFKIMHTDTIPYSYPIGFPQEHIVFSLPEDAVTIDWKPDFQEGLVPGVYELINMNEIVDRKRNPLGLFEWSMVTSGSTFVEYVQKNRLKYIDCDGQDRYAELSGHTIRYKATTDSTWELKEVLPPPPP